MQEIREQRHIAEETWIALKQGSLGTDEYMQILEHTCCCTWCAERLARALEPPDTAGLQVEATDAGSRAAMPPGTVGALPRPPAYLAGQIRERVKQPDVRATTTIRQTSKKLQLLTYSLKVGAAVAFSIIFLGISVNVQNIGFSYVKGDTAKEPPGVVQEEPPGNMRQEYSVLDKVNEAANGVAEQMNAFANMLLNGGKRK